jgi:aminopeptidase N
MTEDLVQFFNARLGRNLTPIFDQYLRRAALPTLELAFDEKYGTVAYRWDAAERAFAMPIKVGKRGQWQTVVPTADWAIMRSPMTKEAFEVATDLFYVNVVRQ